MLDQEPEDFVAKFCRVRPAAYAFACPCSGWNNHANNMQAPAGDSDGSRYKLKMNPRTEACIFLEDKKCSIYQHRPLQVGRCAVCYESSLECCWVPANRFARTFCACCCDSLVHPVVPDTIPPPSSPILVICSVAPILSGQRSSSQLTIGKQKLFSGAKAFSCSRRMLT